MELQCKVQNYDWGKLGLESTVAKLLSSAHPDIAIDQSKPYAELWMGTHPNGPSMIIERGVLLSEYIKDNLDAIGPEEHAEELHKNFPDMYKDPNHKPELAIALTPFEALCGFRPLVEIQNFLKTQQEQGDSQIVLKPVFHSLMTSDKAVVASTLKTLLERLEKEDEPTQSSLLYPLLKRLHADFPGDVGCLSPYFMNYMLLNPGQAIFLKPNLPHAYLSGDCVECMACSDNVVRAGLTPKHIDVPTLVDMLDYSSYAQEQLLFNPQLEDCNSCVWRPPVPDFAVVRIKDKGIINQTKGMIKYIDVPTLVDMLDYSSYAQEQLLFNPQLEDCNSCVWRPPVPDFDVVRIKVESGDSYNTQNRSSPSLIIITSGQGEACDTEPIAAKPGVVIFLKASRQLTLTPAEGHHLEVYQAICNV
ncbi:hypothetical protein B5X24_HaOG213011 [Helicoverpa armigera]|nr:hypothetical protein B5X24_HaOG213011 [Helicoverpa armigera]